MDPRLTKIPEANVGLAEVRAILASLELRREPIGIERVQGGGYSGAVYLIDVVDGPALVLKLYPREPWWRMAKEVYVAGLLERAPGVAAPRFLLADDSCALLPLRFAVMTRLKGRRLALCEEEMSETELASIWSEAGAQLRRIHATTMEAFGYLIADKLSGRSDSNRGYMDAAWHIKIKEFRSRGGDENLAYAMDQRWRALADLLDGCAEPKLCHYDYHPGNLLAVRDGDGWRISGVFDFENAFDGDPLMDIAKCVHFARVGTQVRWQGILDGYGAIDRPSWRETIELYRLYQAVEFWNWLVFLDRPEVERERQLADMREILEALR
jgi:aminoglycoside phosphotransferase (APT) family kinase protein